MEAVPVLVPMSDAEYASFVATSVVAYAADKVASGEWSREESLELARKALEDLLPQGRQIADNHLFSVLDDQARRVGTLWIGVKEQAGQRIAYIYDMRIAPECQRRGHAKRALAAAEDEARKLGLCGIGLHVFGHNGGARALYEALGYRPTNITMFKPL